MEPPLADNGGSSVFLYAPAVFNGLPWWVFKMILLTVVPFVLLLIAIYQIPDDFPLDNEEGKIVDADLVTMTKAEMGRRLSYDESNEQITRRRSSISAVMKEIAEAAPPRDAALKQLPGS